MSDGIVFLARVFLSALWFGRPHLISIITVSSFSRRRKGELFISAGLSESPRTSGIIHPISKTPNLSARGQSTSVSHLPVLMSTTAFYLHLRSLTEREREREQASGKAHMDRFLRSSNIADSKRLISARGEAFDDGCHNFAARIWGRHQTCLLHVLLKANWSSIPASQRNSAAAKQTSEISRAVSW